jgi:deazaflavin-dependent oxidoreductase (nitroreductase family)
MWFDPLMSAVLRSPLHGLLSRSIMLVTVRGRKSGRAITTPVNYVPVGEELLTVSLQHRTWWRNLRGGASVLVRLRGSDREARGNSVEDPAGVISGIGEVIGVSPAYARHFGVPLDRRQSPDPAALARAAEGRVLIRFRLDG